MDAIGRWWDGVELWVTGLPFVLQVLVVMIVVVPLAALIAIVLDMLVTWLFTLVGRGDEAGRDTPAPGAGAGPDADAAAGPVRPDSAHRTESED